MLIEINILSGEKLKKGYKLIDTKKNLYNDELKVLIFGQKNFTLEGYLNKLREFCRFEFVSCQQEILKEESIYLHEFVLD